ncbi:unnamed protein product, partial [Cylicostephanus goldi]
CGLSSATVPLLPSKSVFTDEAEADVVFDGVTNAVIVPSHTVPGNLAVKLLKYVVCQEIAILYVKFLLAEVIPDKFSLSFSMKHAAGTKDDQKNKKNILCESDEDGMNRHHFAVYVRHCKLEVVLRREAGSKAEFRAAEWRWATPQSGHLRFPSPPNDRKDRKSPKNSVFRDFYANT